MHFCLGTQEFAGAVFQETYLSNYTQSTAEDWKVEIT